MLMCTDHSSALHEQILLKFQILANYSLTFSKNEDDLIPKIKMTTPKNKDDLTKKNVEIS